MYKQILLGNDAWSKTFIDFHKSQPHYQTTLLWKESEKIKIKDTPYYKWLKETLLKEGCIWDGILKTEEDIIHQCNQFYTLFKNTPDWKATETKNINSRIINDKQFYFGNFPTLIDNKGDFYIWDGRHRLACLLSKNYNIKLTICERDLEWIKLLEDLDKLYPNKALYQPIWHPDFDDWNPTRDETKEIMLKDIFEKFNIKRVIDLGCCHGFTLYYLRKMITEAIGVEYHPIRHKIASIVLNKCDFKCYNLSIQNYILQNSSIFSDYDCILALACLHHIARESSLEEFNYYLLQISKAKILIYELPNEREEQFNWIYSELRNNIHEHIQKITRLNKKIVLPYFDRKIIVLYNE